MKKTVVLLLIFTAMMYTAVCPSYARDPAPASVLQLLNEIKAQITSGQQQLEGLPAKVDALTTKVDTLTTKVDSLTTKVDELSGKFDAGLTVTVTPKSYYLTNNPVEADDVDSACDPGFHMASYWEILDTTTLYYDQEASRSYLSQPDQGSGPPSDIAGWVRTGNASNAGDTAGTANCNNWTSTEHDEYGTVVRLLEVWKREVPIDTTNRFTEFAPPWWLPGVAYCDATSVRVWCVQD